MILEPNNSKWQTETVMLRTQNQVYISPSQLLRKYIAHYTISWPSANVGPDKLVLIPDASGCLIFTDDGKSVNSKLWGATTKAITVDNDVNRYPFRLFIEFRPGGLFSLTGTSQTELTDLQTPLPDRQLHSFIVEAYEKARDLSSFISRLNGILLSRIEQRMIPPAIDSAIETIRLHKGCISVKELATKEFYSSRHLNRLFTDYLGTNIKTYTTIVRINSVLQLMKGRQFSSGEFAHMAEFYDQSHFINAFRTICGATPKKYFENMSDFYNEPFKF